MCSGMFGKLLHSLRPDHSSTLAKESHCRSAAGWDIGSAPAANTERSLGLPFHPCHQGNMILNYTSQLLLTRVQAQHEVHRVEFTLHPSVEAAPRTCHMHMEPFQLVIRVCLGEI